MQGKAINGLCLGTRPGEATVDDEGVARMDRHEVAHCVLTSHCSSGMDPPTVLTEGWAEANQGSDPIEQADFLRAQLENGSGLALRELIGPNWCDPAQAPV